MIAHRVESKRLVLAAALAVFLLCLLVSWALAETPRLEGWTLEPGVDAPSYAVTEPVSSNLNIDTVALLCEEGASSRIVQLQLYLSDAGPLAPKGVAASALKPNPRVEVVIDRRAFAANLYFADDYALVADSERERYPMLSESLLEAMAHGRTMTLRFDLVAKAAGKAPAFDSEAVIDLLAGRGGQAVNAVRRCATPAADRFVGIARAGD
jgi:hypothetical protein